MPTITHSYSAIEKRKRRVRGKLFGTSTQPRVSVYRSNKHIFVQAIDDTKGTTVASAHDTMLKSKDKLTKTQKAQAVAQILATALQKVKVGQVVFDRGAYRYHGRVKAVAEALREAGIRL